MVSAPSILLNDEERGAGAALSSARTGGPERRFRRFGEAIASNPPPASLNLTPPPAAAPPPGGDLEEPSGDAFAAKAFIGPNATYYDDRWRWMSWRGRSHGWNWAAAGTFGVWLAYRKMYRWAAVYLSVFAVLFAVTAGGVPLIMTGAVLLTAGLLLGTFGNILYFHHFRAIARSIEGHYPDHGSRLRAVIAAGGVDARAARMMVVNLLVAAGLGIGIGLLIGGLRLV